MAKIGNSSIVFALDVFLKGQDEVLATGKIVWVSLDKTTHRPVRVCSFARHDLGARGKRFAGWIIDCCLGVLM